MFDLVSMILLCRVLLGQGYGEAGVMESIPNASHRNRIPWNVLKCSKGACMGRRQEGCAGQRRGRNRRSWFGSRKGKIKNKRTSEVR